MEKIIIKMGFLVVGSMWIFAGIKDNNDLHSLIGNMYLIASFFIS